MQESRKMANEKWLDIKKAGLFALLFSFYILFLPFVKPYRNFADNIYILLPLPFYL